MLWDNKEDAEDIGPALGTYLVQHSWICLYHNKIKQMRACRTMSLYCFRDTDTRISICHISISFEWVFKITVLLKQSAPSSIHPWESTAVKWTATRHKSLRCSFQSTNLPAQPLRGNDINVCHSAADGEMDWRMRHSGPSLLAHGSTNIAYGVVQTERVLSDEHAFIAHWASGMISCPSLKAQSFTRLVTAFTANCTYNSLLSAARCCECAICYLCVCACVW